MRLIRCTAKLRNEMGLRSTVVDSDTEPPQGLGHWHANLIFINRRKTVLFVNDKTLFNFVAPDVKRAGIRELDKLFRSFLQCVVAEENLGEEVESRIKSEYADIRYANSNNRSVLGSMNDLAFHYEHLAVKAGGVHSPELPSIVKQLNRMPMGAVSHRYAIDGVRAVYGVAT